VLIWVSAVFMAIKGGTEALPWASQAIPQMSAPWLSFIPLILLCFAALRNLVPSGPASEGGSSPATVERPKSYTDLQPDAGESLAALVRTSTEETENPVYLGSNVTPAFLVGHFKDRTSLEAREFTRKYVGKWLRVTAIFEDIFEGHDNQLDVVVYTPSSNKDGEAIQPRVDVYCWFRHQQDEIRVRQIGDPMKIEGRIESIDSGSITLKDCKLIDATTFKDLQSKYGNIKSIDRG